MQIEPTTSSKAGNLLQGMRSARFHVSCVKIPPLAGRCFLKRVKAGLLILGLCCFLPIQANAQKIVTGYQFRTFGWGVRMDDLYFARDGEDVKVKIYDGLRSPFLEFTEAETILFYRMEVDDEGVVIRTPVLTVPVAEAGKWPLLIFTPDEDVEGGLRCKAIADDLESFPQGSFRFINLTAVKLGIAMGDEMMVMEPREMKTMVVEAGDDPNEATRFIRLVAETKSGPVRIYSNNWVVKPTQRTLVLIHVHRDQLGVRRVRDSYNQYRRFLQPDSE